ncbi:MAG: hypothetical protein CM1200mP41_26460 [Gammaproteobacteria bacterium]|nr:MAG: hypothetical protein CM1200mP41_26460 [Gammaproteobacteria bacterium]
MTIGQHWGWGKRVVQSRPELLDGVYRTGRSELYDASRQNGSPEFSPTLFGPEPKPVLVP